MAYTVRYANRREYNQTGGALSLAPTYLHSLNPLLPPAGQEGLKAARMAP